MKKFFLNLWIIPSLIFSENDIPYSNREISEIIYKEYLTSTEMMIDCIFFEDYKYLQGYSEACLSLFKRINLIED